uniref:Uncharacterized protein n=1 Tax=Rhizophora mucronata TaxID=61149 RepID=A0A2P2PHE0_RHIMU
MPQFNKLQIGSLVAG